MSSFVEARYRAAYQLNLGGAAPAERLEVIQTRGPQAVAQRNCGPHRRDSGRGSAVNGHLTVVPKTCEHAFDMDGGPGRRCARCSVVKPDVKFAVKDARRGTRRSYCHDCAREYGREHYARNKPVYLGRAKARRKLDRKVNRDLIAGYLEKHPCVDCGESDPRVLEFDHREREKKKQEVARLVSTGSKGVVLREIAKCDVRCANCHRRRTAHQFAWKARLATP